MRIDRRTTLLARLMTPVCVALLSAATLAAETPYFTIQVVDDETGRGVPLVELETVNHLRFVTDSQGIAAFHEPGFMDQRVFFHVKSHGYEFAKDGFGYAGKALDIRPNGSATLRIKRVNVAERLYRVTGAGIYADSLLVGRDAPTSKPLLNGLVLGSDSVQMVEYRGQLRWFWGDTNRAAYPLGNFHTPGATSRLPNDGGLDPAVGVDLRYFVNDQGFAKEMARMEGEGPTWISGLAVVGDERGEEALMAGYVKVRAPMEVYRHGLARYDDERDEFRHVVTFAEGETVYPEGHTFLHRDGETEFVYFANPYPLTRVAATTEAMAELSRYEVFTCLKVSGASGETMVDRGDDGRARYAWRTGAPAWTTKLEAEMVEQGKLDEDERLLALRDVDTGKRVNAHGGSVYWNAWRGRWVMIALESFGTSFLGEIWYAEADNPTGPWLYARKIVTHDKYSFYNPKHHPQFDQADGRVIYFEGTYTTLFSGNQVETPRYDYNQIMYRLDLNDRRLNLPVAIYALDRGESFARRDDDLDWRSPCSPAFFALDRPTDESVAVSRDPATGRLRMVGSDDPTATMNDALFHAMPADAKPLSATCVTLHEFASDDGARFVYDTNEELDRPGFARRGIAIARVWRSPFMAVQAFEK